MKKIIVVATGFALLTVLILAAKGNPLLFHAVVEGYAVIVSMLIFVLGIFTYKHSGNNLLLFLGRAFLFIAVIDSLHLLRQAGIPIFPSPGIDTAGYFRIASRLMEAATLLMAASFINRPAPAGKTYCAYSLAVAILFVAVIKSWNFLTPCIFVLSVIPLAFLGAAYRFYLHRKSIDAIVYRSLLASITASILSGIAFMIGFSEAVAWANDGAHLLKVVSNLSIFFGIIIHGLQRPFELISAQLVEERSRATREFVQIMTHELRNPLTAIKGMCTLLTMQLALGKEVTGLPAKLEMLESEVDHLSGLIDEVSDAFRSYQGRLKLEKREINMLSVVQTALKPVQTFGRANCFLQVEELQQEAAVMGDSKRLEEVIRNLVGNAVKYSPEGSKIEVKLAGDADKLVISVADQGVGIPSDQQKQIFDGFFRARNIAAKDPGGMGLGLFICKNIIEQHGGRIWVKSSEGQGSTFYFSLPLLKQVDLVAATSTIRGGGSPDYQ